MTWLKVTVKTCNSIFFSKTGTIVFQKSVFLHLSTFCKLISLPMKSIFKRGLLLLAFLFGLAFHLAAQSTQMTIHLNDGNERTYFMNESDRVYFEDNETLVVEIAVYGKNVRSDRFNLADIRKITCQETEGVTETSNASVFLSPNPTHDAFMLHNLNGRQSVNIYALDGRLVKSAEVSENQLIDISDLPVGLYLVKTESQTLKMIKL